MRKYFLLQLLFMAFIIPSCSRYSRDPDLRAARDFIAYYYILADQRQTLPYTEGKALEDLEKEIKELEKIGMRNDAYRARDITFELKSEKVEADFVNYFFVLTIKIPQMDDRLQGITIKVNRTSHKVMEFADVK